MKKAITFSVAACLLLGGCNLSGAGTGEFNVSVIDVGKGDCILLQSSDHSVMIDTGYDETVDDIEDYLSDEGVKELDALIITHYDKDHVGGAAELLDSIPVEKAYIPDYESTSSKYEDFAEKLYELDIDSEKVQESVAFTLGEIKYTIEPSGCTYVQNGDAEGNDNDMSLIVTAVYNKDSYFFAGDIEEEAIDKYLSRGGTQADVIKMPHHGRYSTNTEKLIENVSPQIAIVTDDNDNKLDKEVKALLEEREISTYCSRKCGNIKIKGKGTGEYEVKTEED